MSSEIKFPSLPHAEIPEDAVALRAVLAGQRGLTRLYERLEAACRGESKVLARLMGRDFRRRCRSLVKAGEDLLRSLGASEKEIGEVLPLPRQIDDLAVALAKAKPADLARQLGDFASKALFCHRLVPWKSEMAPVCEHFDTCLEAEDSHLGVVELLSGLLSDDPD